MAFFGHHSTFSQLYISNKQEKTTKLWKPITVVTPKTLVTKIEGKLHSPTSVYPQLPKNLETQEVDRQDRQSHQSTKFPLQNLGIAK